MQYWGFLEGARDFKTRSTVKEHTNEVQSGGRDPGVSRPGAGLGQSPTCSKFIPIFFFLVFEFLKNLPVTIVPGVFDVNS